LFGTTAQIIGGGNDTSKAKYWCLISTFAMETDSKQVPWGNDEKHPS